MSGCIGCANQPGDNGSLGGAGHEGTVTPMVIGIIIGTVAIFILVVCALFYCVKLENNKYMAKIGDSSPTTSGDGGGDSSESVKSRPSSVTIVPASVGVIGGATVGVREVGASVGCADGAGGDGPGGAGGGRGPAGEGKRRLFGWGRKSG